MKKLLITGLNSYVGLSVASWLEKCNEQAAAQGKDAPYNVTSISVHSDETCHGEWENVNFGEYDAVLHVAGKAHADVGNVNEEVKSEYYRINTDLTLAVARKARADGCGQFIYMSSMIVYGGKEWITSGTAPFPQNFYGDSKWRADKALQKMNSPDFKVAIIRAPMIYGRGSKGNYPVLSKMASKLPLFPVVGNRRSMLHIDNLCEFVRLLVENVDDGVFFPQNAEFTNTSQMVKLIADVKGHKIFMVHGFSWLVRLLMCVPGKIGALVKKAFGSSCYDMAMSEYRADYRVCGLRESIERTEK